ncbi:MAG: UvrD-helicase domain-containing protein [Planctomycetaceae bacterium]
MDDLTPCQRAAVEHFQGPLLVLAGPGSGKTRVITRRVARLIERGVDPRAILAITFTNKAAGEMAERVATLVPGCRVNVGTFHRFCAKLLRMHGEAVGLRSNFTIYDTADQQRLVRQVLNDLKIDPVTYSPATVLHRIGRAKNDLVTAEDFARQFQSRVGDHREAVVAKVFPEYQRRLLEANAVDFDDLLLHVAVLLSENPELRAGLDERYRYILVDEYQDTNAAQYRIVQALSVDHPNLCATGDPDQSIYGWRGARIDNILRFEQDFPAAAVVRLEENFRSTKCILRAADSLISHNRLRKHKSLVTDNDEGEPVELLCFQNARHESESIAEEIFRRHEAGERNWSDFAVVYRVNALSRETEQALARRRIPFQVASGFAFYDRAEVKDVLAYLRLIENPADAAAFLRIVNTPIRGIGKTTQDRLVQWARARRIGLLEAAARADEHPELKRRPVAALHKFSAIIEELSRRRPDSIEQLVRDAIELSEYTRGWDDDASEVDRQRLANVQELVSAARQYDETAGEDATLGGFLETTALVNDQDNLDDSAGKVTLLTLHSAKGLEFPVVFIVGVEQGLIPHERSIQHGDARELEEERRLLFVGMTRAEQRLALTMAVSRDVRGRPMRTIPSDFVSEMELRFVDQAGVLPAGSSARAHDWPDDAHDPSPEEFPETDASAAEFGNADATPRYDAGASPHASREAASPKPRLMTGADLLNGTRTAVEIPAAFHVGTLVRHPRYGLGKVVAASGVTARRTVTVEFETDARRQTFVAAKSPLQPIGTR